MPGMLSLCKASPAPGAREEPRPTSCLTPGTGQSAFFCAVGCNVTLPRRDIRPTQRTHPGGGRAPRHHGCGAEVSGGTGDLAVPWDVQAVSLVPAAVPVPS